jgi:hypothetical protein
MDVTKQQYADQQAGIGMIAG